MDIKTEEQQNDGKLLMNVEVLAYLKSKVHIKSTSLIDNPWGLACEVDIFEML